MDFIFGTTLVLTEIKNMRFLYFFLFFPFISCEAQQHTVKPTTSSEFTDSTDVDKVVAYYAENKGNELPSQSVGNVGSGSIKHSKLLPFSGKNFSYFDTNSYLGGRAFLNDKLLKTLLAHYSVLENECPDHHFCIMECSNKEGGKIHPHRTHQNGLSVDLMIPLIKDNAPYYALDSIGANHYLLDFDDQGRYLSDPSIAIDFELLAKQIWILQQESLKNGLSIEKVILKIELKDELFDTVYGKKIKSSGIYFAQNLSPIINALHDDHFHVDFRIR